MMSRMLGRGSLCCCINVVVPDERGPAQVIGRLRESYSSGKWTLWVLLSQDTTLQEGSAFHIAF